MNILCYSNKLSNGGAERVMSVLVNELHHRGHKVTLVNDYQFSNDYYIEPQIDHYYINGPITKKNRNPLRRNIERIMFLRNICISQKIDVILSFMSDANFRAILSTVGLKTKNIISVRIDPAMAYKNKLRAIMAKIYYTHADGCVFQTQQAKEWYPQRIQNHSMVILNPISKIFFETTGKPGSEKRIVAAGRLTRQKRFDVLIDAFAKVHIKYPDYSLEIFGEGELKEQLQEKINNLDLQDSAMLSGRSEHINEDIKNSSVFVLSSDFEGLPNSLMEAIVLGLPCVSTDCSGGGARAILDDTINGVIVPCGESDALAEGILKIIDDKKFAHMLSENALIRGHDFATEKVIDKWEQYLLNVLDK